MKHMQARSFLTMTPDEKWSLPFEDIILECDDGELQTTVEETIYSSYSWNIHQKYTMTPLLRSHHMAGKALHKHTHCDCSNEGLWDCLETYRQNGVKTDYEEFKEDLSKLVYIAFNELHNDVTAACDAYVVSVSALDIIEVLEHPAVMAAMERLQKSTRGNHYTCDDCNADILKVLRDPMQLIGNGISEIIQSGTVKAEQVLQCVGARGSPTDIDSNVFPQPIREGFGHGFHELWETMQESRSASKSLLYTGDPMQKSEYANRNIQLSAGTLAHLYQEDCGSTKYLPITLETSHVDSRKRILSGMEGFTYYDEDTKKEKVLGVRDTHLLGKTLPFRTVFTCQHPDRRGVCVKCFGQIGESIPRWSNLGHVSAVQLQGPVTQLLMSNKHYEMNAKADQLTIGVGDRTFIRLGALDQHIYLNQALKKGKFRIIIHNDDAPNLSDIHAVRSVKQLVPVRLSSIVMIVFEFTNNTNERVAVTLGSGSRTASLTLEVLAFLREKKWTRDFQGNYAIDMTGWDYDKPFAVLPLRHFSTLDYMLQINTFFKGGSSKRASSIMSYESPTAALMAFHDLVGLKLNVNVSYLQALILSTMAQDRLGRDFRLPWPRDHGVATRYHEQMQYRSLSAAMAFQWQAKVVFNTSAYLIQNRPPHPLDSLWMGGGKNR